MSDCIRSTHLLLLPGMMCDELQWLPQVTALSPHCTVDVAAIDQACTVADIARQVLANAPAQFALAGLSMGGIVALEIWRQAPARVQRLALLDTNYLADAPERAPIRNRQMEDVRAGRLREVLAEEMKPNYLASVHRHNRALLDQVLEMGMQQGPGCFIRQSLALRDRPDSSATLATIDCPALVLCGDEDTLCPVALHQSMAAAITGAALQIIENCGHLSTMEQPAAVTHAMQQWLQAA